MRGRTNADRMRCDQTIVAPGRADDARIVGLDAPDAAASRLIRVGRHIERIDLEARFGKALRSEHVLHFYNPYLSARRIPSYDKPHRIAALSAMHRSRHQSKIIRITIEMGHREGGIIAVQSGAFVDNDDADMVELGS